MKQRSGVIHVLEAVIAAMILFFFILVVVPSADQGGDTGFAPDKQSFNILSALDTAGALRDNTAAASWNQVKQDITPYMPTRTVEVAAVTLNATNFDGTITGSHTTTFTVKNSVERQILRVWYRGADNPTVYVNGQQISSLNGNITGDYQTYDTAQETSTGTNTLNITVDSASDIGYSIDRYTREETGLPPAGADTVTASYLIAGVNSSFQPTEVNVLSWQ